VLLVGGNPARGTYEQHREIYSPSYLFDTDGSAALRPVITGVTPGAFVYGDTFQVFTSAAASIVIFTLPGVFQASLTVTDNAGATSQPAFPAESFFDTYRLATEPLDAYRWLAA